MGHFAKVVDNKVTQVIVAEPDFFDTFVDSSPGVWIQTSYNTIGGVHTQGKEPLRGNFAGIGYIYDQANDVFYTSQPFPSWILNNQTWTWDSPVPHPNDGRIHFWNEDLQQWIPAES